MKSDSKFLILLSTSIFLQSFSFLSIKISTFKEGLEIYLFILLAFIFMGLRAIVWQFLLKLAQLSIIYPLAALVQVLILIYAVLFFDERITIFNIVGLTVMLGGIFYLIPEKST